MTRFLPLFLLLLLLFSSCGTASADIRSVPILMYHDISADSAPDNAFTVPLSLFDEHLSALADAGYTSVTFADLISFVYFDGDLPERPVVITADDGYTNVLTLAAPAAARHGMTISCAVIGSLSGSGSHFSMDGDIPSNVEIISHTYALHDRTLTFAPELGSYEQLLTYDYRRMCGCYAGRFPQIPTVLVYPHGVYSTESEQILHHLGVLVTVTCDAGVAVLEKGNPESLYALPRISVWKNTNLKELMAND